MTQLPFLGQGRRVLEKVRAIHAREFLAPSPGVASGSAAMDGEA